MKKIFLILAAALCVATVSAQNKFQSAVQAVASQKWSVGARLGSGFQAQAECFYGDKTYVEGRFGMQWVAGVTADFTVLHNWNCFTMDWTPSVGKWFFDAGVGLNVGGAEHYAYIGVVGQAKLGLKFNKVPIRLAFDWSPSFGPGIAYFGGKSSAGFNTYGLCNLGFSATYCF
jgi:hypothetical protein